jgi:hypothetical protein
LTTVALLQLDVSETAGDVEAVVTLAGASGDEADDDPPNKLEKKPVTPDPNEVPGVAADEAVLAPPVLTVDPARESTGA